MCLNCDLSLFFSVLLRSSTNAIVNPSKVKQVSSKSRAFVYEGFLTELGCDHMRVDLSGRKLRLLPEAFGRIQGLLVDLSNNHLQGALVQPSLVVVYFGGPKSRATHWKQTVMYLEDRLTICEGETITGSMHVGFL
ncbi:unnamed protein product [Brassica oleracea var. botrytis]